MSLDAALIGSAALMGLAGAPHCAAMCGAAQTSLAGGARRPMLLLQLGRLASYAAAGALVRTLPLAWRAAEVPSWARVVVSVYGPEPVQAVTFSTSLSTWM